MRNASVPMVAVLSFLVPLAAGARPCDAAGSLVPNCGFDAGLDGWTFTAEPATWVTDGCATAPGCVSLDRPAALGSVEAISDCFDVDPSAEYAHGGSFRVESGTVSQVCGLEFVLYTDTNCETFLDFEFAAFAITSAWREQIAGISTTAATQSAKLRLACFSEATDFVVRIDDGLVLPAVFVDGFASGNLSRWSSSAP